MDLGGAKRSRSPSAASPAAFWVISLVPPGEAQRSGFAGKRRSKGTSAVFATRRKRSRVDFATTSRHGQSHAPPAGGEIPLRKEPSSGPMRASGPTKKRSIVVPSSVWPSASHLSLSPLAFGHLPLTRGVGPRGGRLLGGSAPSSGLFGATFPPGGRLYWGAPLIRPGERPGKAGGPVCRPYEKSGETLYIKL